MSEKLEIDIREALPSDRDFLFEMLYQSIFVAPGADPPGREVLHLPKIRRYVEDWGREGDYALVAEKDSGDGEDRRVGALSLRFFPANFPGYGFIDETIPEIGIAVVPVHRGKGVGSALLTALLDRSDSRYPAISLSVDPENPAVNLYRRFGFVECGRSGASIVMRYDLQ